MRYIAAKVSEGKEVFQGFPAVALSLLFLPLRKTAAEFALCQRAEKSDSFIGPTTISRAVWKAQGDTFPYASETAHSLVWILFFGGEFPRASWLFLALPSVCIPITRHASVRSSGDNSTWCKPVFTLSFPCCPDWATGAEPSLSLRNKMCLLVLQNHLQSGCNRTGSSPRFSAQVCTAAFGTVITSLSTSGFFPLSSINF